MTGGQVHESTMAESMIEAAVATLMGKRRKDRGRRHKPEQVAGDKAYSNHHFREFLETQNIEPVIPHKENEAARHDPSVWFDKVAYRGRHVVEQCIGWLKEFRRIGTRYEKLAVNFLAMLHLAMIKRYFRLLF